MTLLMRVLRTIVVLVVGLHLGLGFYLDNLGESLFRKRQSRLTALSSLSNKNDNDDSNRHANAATPSSSFSIPPPVGRIQHRDAVIVGGALAGLSAALYLSQMDPTRHITIFERQDINERGTVASFAAAGMLAPNAERLPGGPLLELCLSSRRMYPDFCHLVETLAKESGAAGAPYLASNSCGSSSTNDKNDLEPWNVGYVASGGFLAPAFAGDAVATWAPPDESSAIWLDATQVLELEPNLHADVQGAWWFPEDASVDAARLTCSLRAACVAAGVQILSGSEYEVTSLDLGDGECRGLWLKNGKYIQCKSLLIANGAWMRNLLPVPIEPHKGQSLSLRMPPGQPPLLRRVLFAQDSYIVPKADGRIVIGATVEAGSYDPNVTPAGLLHILTHALQLIPALKDLPIEDTWVGLRPTTPDKGPILGKTPWKNLFLAGGYWRNGVLLAPKTGQLLAALMMSSSSGGDDGDRPVHLSPSDEQHLAAFGWDRFTSKEGGTALAVSARYAASMHPIHNRKSGSGVAASVGTELGFYSSARSAASERQSDRQSLWGSSSDNNSAFERAAAMGRQDGTVFSFGDIEKPARKVVAAAEPDTKETPPAAAAAPATNSVPASPPQPVEATTTTYEGSADAFTVGSASLPSTDVSDLNSMYKVIQENKAQNSLQLDDSSDDEDDQRPDPGFRIYYVDPETREKIVIPPYTSPGEFLASLEKTRKASRIPKQPLDSTNPVGSTPRMVNEDTSSSSSSSSRQKPKSEETNYSKKTYDGYQDIQDANASTDRGEELKRMKIARTKNRIGFQSIDPSSIGAQRMKDEDDP